MAMSTTSAIPVVGIAEPLTTVKRRTPAGDAIRTLRQRPVALIGLGVLVTWILLGLLAPVLPLEPQNGQIKIENKLEAPSWSHPFGTDDAGRDVLARVIYAARASVPAGFLVVFCACTIGAMVGAASGYIGGFIDTVIMRACDGVLAFPSIILAMAIAVIRGEPSLQNAMFAVVLVFGRNMPGSCAVRSSASGTTTTSWPLNRSERPDAACSSGTSCRAPMRR